MLFPLLFLALFVLLWLLFLGLEPALGGLVTRGAHFAAKFRYRDYLPVAVVLACGLAVTGVAGDAFIDIAERVHANSPQVRQVDTTAHRWAATNRTSGSTFFFVLMTHLGDPATLGLIVLGVSITLAMRRRWRWMTYLLLTTGVGGLLNLQLKAYFARARPELAEALRTAHGYSFPSGHAMGSTIVLGAICYLALRNLHTWRTRAASLALSTSLVIAIAVSRVYIGVHWISDVVAGVAAGLIWLLTATIAYETFRRIRMVRSLRTKRAGSEPPSSG